ncbi:hypothetical protein [Nocardioides sp.]|uniref:hypothetical protein n=1 Tax=Nocardioides sp. TaxID=35761 RepID=UPI0035B38B6C
MTRTATRRLAVPAAALVLSLLATGCGGGIDASAAPEDATTDDFCLTWVRQVTTLVAKVQADVTQERQLPTGEEVADVFHAWAEEMKGVGTPSGMSDEARTGFKEALEQTADLDADDFDPEDYADDVDLVAEWASLSSEEFHTTRALSTYIQDTCSSLYRERGLL